MVVLNEKLPTTQYLSYGTLSIVTNKPLPFTLNCQSYESNQGGVKIIPPFPIIQLNNMCKASNDHLQLPEYFGKTSHFRRSDPLHAQLKLHNVSQFVIWNDSKTQIERSKSIGLTSHLLGMKGILMQSFLRETKAFKMVNIDTKQHSSSWTISAVSPAASIFVLIIIIWWVIKKVNAS